MVTITLTDEDAINYLRTKHIPTKIELPTETNHVVTGLERSLEKMKQLADDVSEPESPTFTTTPEPSIPEVKYTQSGKSWSADEEAIITEAIKANYRANRSLKYIRRKLPHRTDAAIRSRLHKFGAKVKQGYIV